MARTASLSPSATRSRAALLAAVVFSFFFAAYILTASGDIFSTGDTTIRVELAENIMGRWSVALNGWQLIYPPHIKKEYLDPRVDTGVHGLTYSTYLLGQPLAIIPFDWLGQQVAGHERWTYGPTVTWFARMVGPLFGALEVTVFFLFATRLGYGRWVALILTAIFGFATSVWPDEQSVLEHGEVAFFLLLGYFYAFRFRDQGAGWWYLILSGLAFSGAAITRYQDAFLGLLGLGLYLILPGGPAAGWLPRLKWLALGMVGLLPAVAIDLWYSWIRFGSPFVTGHHETLFGYPMILGIPGLLVSPGKGLLWYCPTIFLLAFAAPRFARRFPALAVGMAGCVAGFVVFYANVTFWHGDPAWGPRYIFPIVPFLTLPLGEIFYLRFRRAALMWAVVALTVGASFTIQFAAVSVSQWRTWYRVIAYEENQGSTWQWIASRYRYFWNVHESPLNFQVHGLYQLAYDAVRHSNKYEITPPDEDPFLDGITNTYAINQWSFWWLSNEFNWWMGEDKVVLGVLALTFMMLASGTFLVADAAGVFTAARAVRTDKPIPEAA